MDVVATDLLWLGVEKLSSIEGSALEKGFKSLSNTMMDTLDSGSLKVATKNAAQLNKANK